MGNTVSHNEGLLFFVALTALLSFIAVVMMGQLLGFHLVLS